MTITRFSDLLAVFVLLAALFVLVAGCATLIDGTRQEVALRSQPSKAMAPFPCTFT